jgi:hypothetical protein
MLWNCLSQNVQCVLGELLKSLDKTYTRVLKEIDEANQDEVYCLLQCLMVSIQPRSVMELVEILAVDFDNGEGIPKLNPDWRWEDQERSLQAACLSLITIIDTSESRVVQFSHFLVKEFLTLPQLACSSGEVSWYHISLKSAHTVLAQACLSVLLGLDNNIVKHRPNEDSSVEDSTVASNHWSASESLARWSATTVYPLARYATEHWVTHVQFKNVLSCV